MRTYRDILFDVANSCKAVLYHGYTDNYSDVIKAATDIYIAEIRESADIYTAGLREHTFTDYGVIK
jgi:hypothetical protein